MAMNDSNLTPTVQSSKVDLPAASRRRDWHHGDGAGPPGPGSGHQGDLVPAPCSDWSQDIAVAVSHASEASPLKRDTAAATFANSKSTWQPSSFSAMDAKPTPGTAASARAFPSPEQSSQSVLNGFATSAMHSAIDRPIPQPISPERQSYGSASRLISPSKTMLAARGERVHGHKRTATGEIKSTLASTMSQGLTANGICHARTMSADSNSSRIAELSAQLRARLSYAAAKVEKSWQTRQGDGDRQLSNGSPEGTTVSAPDSLRLCTSNGVSGLSFGAGTAPSSSWSRPQSSRSNLTPQITPLHMQHPKLAPPADIVASGGGSGPRRRPNPNVTSDYNPYPRHRRHYSEQEARVSASANHSAKSHTIVIPGTPPLGSSQSQSRVQASTPNIVGNGLPVKHRTPSQNALMEQDAIETLLFMSSPENSGYHPRSQSRQTNVSTSIESQMGSTLSSQSSNGSNGSHAKLTRKVESLDNASVSGVLSNHLTGPEAQAGDEIDRMLDQMKGANDRDGETHFSSYDFIDGWKH